MTVQRKETVERVLEWALRLVLGGIFLWAGVLKAKDPMVFAEQIRGYQLIGDPLVAATALALPWLEILTGLGVMVRRLYLGSLLILAGMLTVFAVALGSAWIRGLDITCGCFGEAEGEVENFALHYALGIFRNVVLVGVCGVLLAMDVKRQARRAGQGRVPMAQDPGLP